MFGVIWLTFTFFASRGFLTDSVDNTRRFVAVAFFTAFSFVGFGMILKWLASRCRKVWLILAPAAICRRESLGPFGRHQVFPLADVAGLLCRREDNKAEENRIPQPEALFVVRKDARDSFAVKARYPSPLYSLFCVIGCVVAIGAGHNFLKDYANGEIFLIDLFGVAGGCFFILFGLYNLLSKTTFFFLPDRLLKSIRFFSHVRTKEYPRAKITGADCAKQRNNWSLSLTMSNEDKIGLVDMGGRDSLSWLKSVVEAWLERTPQREEPAVAAPVPADAPQSRVLLDPPEGVTRLSPAQLAALEKKLCAAGQPALSPAAVAVEVKCPLLITILGGGFLLTWLCGWYASAPAMIGKIFREGLSGNIGTLLGVLFFGCIGLLPVRAFGTFLFTGTVLVFEPGCLRVRRRYGVFSRARRFEHREVSGAAWGDRVIGILTTVELFTEDGKRMTLLEDSEKSPRLRWLARVLREEIAPEDYDGERAGYLFPGCLQNLLMHKE